MEDTAVVGQNLDEMIDLEAGVDHEQSAGQGTSIWWRRPCLGVAKRQEQPWSSKEGKFVCSQSPGILIYILNQVRNEPAKLRARRVSDGAIL